MSHCNSDGVITYNVPTNGGNQDKRFITMGNVTRLIVGVSKQSRSTEIKEKAKGYEKWIFDEVIHLYMLQVLTQCQIINLITLNYFLKQL